MPLIIRALLTGFGYKIGAEIGRYVAERIGLKKPEKVESEFPAGMEDEDGEPDPDEGDSDANAENEDFDDGVAAD